MNIAREVKLPDGFVATHETAGLPNFPAIDVFAPPGSYVLAPEAGRLVWPHMIEWDASKRVGGMTCYLAVREGTVAPRWYFLTHFYSVRRRAHYRVGDVLGVVASVPGNAWAPHIHVGKHRGRFTPAAS